MPAERRGLLDRGRGDQSSARAARRAPRARRRDAPRDRPGCCRARRTPAPESATRVRSRRRSAARSAGDRRPRRPAAGSPRSSSACPAAASSARRASSSVSLRVRAEPAATCSICSLSPLHRAELLRRRWRRSPRRGGRPRWWCRRSRRAPGRRRRSAPPRRPPPPARAPSGPDDRRDLDCRSPPAGPGPPARPGGSARRGRGPRPPPPRSRGPSRPARAASIAALSAIRLVRSAISRMVPMKPLIRVVSAPSSATCSTLPDDESLEPDQPLDRLADDHPVAARHRRPRCRSPAPPGPPAPPSRGTRSRARRSSGARRRRTARGRPSPAACRATPPPARTAEPRSDSVTRASAVTCSPICADRAEQRPAQLGDVDRGGHLVRQRAQRDQVLAIRRRAAWDGPPRPRRAGRRRTGSDGRWCFPRPCITCAIRRIAPDVAHHDRVARRRSPRGAARTARPAARPRSGRP